MYVLITGATSGIGYALAEEFAKRGHNLVLVGRNKQKLKVVQQQIESIIQSHKQKSKVIGIEQDLGVEDAARCIYNTVKDLGIEVEVLINNAGMGYAGEFEMAEDAQITSLISVNMTQLTLLTKYFVKDMKQRRKGKILNVASTGAYCPGAYIAAYYATKAYVLSLSEALYEELKSYGILVSSLCPGATLTNFQKASGRADTKLAMAPDFVAKKAYKGLQKNKKIIVPGIRNKLMIRLPKRIAIKVIKRYQKSTLI